MYYLNPALLKFLPVAALVAVMLVHFNYLRKRGLQKAFGDEQLLKHTSKPLPQWRYGARALFAALTAVSILLALARPIIDNGEKMIAQGTVDVVVGVDTSRSMAAMDYEGKVPPSAVAKPEIDPDIATAPEKTLGTHTVPVDMEPGTRLEMVRHVILDYMLAALDGNQVAVVSYAGRAFPQAFLTRDTSALRWVIDRGLTISSAPGEGSAVGKALQLAIALFDADSPPDHEKLFILFSDGGNDDKRDFVAEQAAEMKKRGIKVIVIAMGNIMPAKIPVSKLAFDDDYANGLRQHGTKFYENEKGEVEKTGMDAVFLQGLVNQAGGRLIHMQNAADLNLLQYVGKKSQARVPGTVELFPYALGASLLFLLLTFAVTKQWRRRKQS